MTIKERVDRISDKSDISIDMLPTTCKIEICGMCSFDCEFCYHRVMKANGERQSLMSYDNFIKVLNEIDTLKSIKEIGLFYMGESGMHPLLDVFYKELKNRGYFTYLTANGSYTKNIIKALPYIDSLKISWNYKNEDDYYKKTNSNIPYETIIANITLLYNECKRLNKEFTISTILDTTKDDYKDILKTLPYDEHYWLPLQSQNGTINGVGGVVGQYDNQAFPLPCWSLFKGLYIDVDLNIRCCCYGHYKEHIIGSLLDKPLLDIIKSDKLVKMKYQHLNDTIPPECLKCIDGE